MIPIKPQGLENAIAVACGAKFLFTKELLPAIMYGVLMEEDSATQVFVMKGDRTNGLSNFTVY